MRDLERSIYEDRIANLESALNLALCYLSNFEPPDSRAVSDEFVAMAAIHMDGGVDHNNLCMPIIEAGIEAVKRQNVIDEWVKNNTTNMYVTFSDIQSENT